MNIIKISTSPLKVLLFIVALLTLANPLSVYAIGIVAQCNTGSLPGGGGPTTTAYAEYETDAIGYFVSGKFIAVAAAYSTSGPTGYNGIGFHKPALQNAFVIGYIASGISGQFVRLEGAGFLGGIFDDQCRSIYVKFAP